MFIYCPDYSRKSLKQKGCALGAGGSSCAVSSLFPSWWSAFSPSARLLGASSASPTGVRGGKEEREAESDSSWGLQSAASNKGFTNTHIQLLTSAGSLEVAGDGTTWPWRSVWGAGLCFPRVEKNRALIILKMRRQCHCPHSSISFHSPASPASPSL